MAGAAGVEDHALGALTPAYASPEMLEGQAPDPRDDVFALACIIYELLTGRHPFGRAPALTARADELTVLMTKVVGTKSPPPKPDLIAKAIKAAEEKVDAACKAHRAAIDKAATAVKHVGEMAASLKNAGLT